MFSEKDFERLWFLYKTLKLETYRKTVRKWCVLCMIELLICKDILCKCLHTFTLLSVTSSQPHVISCLSECYSVTVVAGSLHIITYSRFR